MRLKMLPAAIGGLGVRALKTPASVGNNHCAWWSVAEWHGVTGVLGGPETQCLWWAGLWQLEKEDGCCVGLPFHPHSPSSPCLPLSGGTSEGPREAEPWSLGAWVPE